MKVKRFVVFTICQYYPGGGMNDFHSSHDTIDEAETAAKAIEPGYLEWYEIIDLENFEPN